MLPRLEARDSLVMAERIAVGMGRLKAAEHGAAIRRWQRQAEPPAPQGIRTPGGLVAALAAAGVPVRAVPRQAVTRRRRRARKAAAS